MDEVAFGRYRLIEVIGEGGVGTVYKAHDIMMRRDVAIKVLPAELATEPGYRERFLREGYTAGARGKLISRCRMAVGRGVRRPPAPRRPA